MDHAEPAPIDTACGRNLFTLSALNDRRASAGVQAFRG